MSACVDRLRATTLLVVTRPSGSGKSSLLRAGLVPALFRVERPVVTFVPGSDPDAAMCEALAGAVGRATLMIDQYEELFALAAVDAGQVFYRRMARYAQDAPVIVGVRAGHVRRTVRGPALARLAERGMYLLSPLSGVTLRQAVEQPAVRRLPASTSAWSTSSPTTPRENREPSRCCRTPWPEPRRGREGSS